MSNRCIYQGETRVHDPRIDGLARLLVNYCVATRPGDWVLIRGDLVAQPLVARVYAQVLAAGGHPTVVYHDEQAEEAFYRTAGAAQLAWRSPVDELLAERVDARIVIRAPGNTRALTGVDPAAQRTHQLAQKPITDRYRDRAATGAHRWTLTNFPCPALAQDADMSLADFEDFVYAATYADQPNPVAAWQAVHTRQQRLVDWLAGKSAVVVRGPHVDLRLAIAGRTFINSDGKRNMPSGEIFTGPVEDSAQGWVKFTYPALRGLMTWSINWDAVSNCAVADEYAQAYEDIFGITTAVQDAADVGINEWPLPVDAGVLHIGGLHGGEDLLLLDAIGRVVAMDRAASDRVDMAFDLPTGAYVLRVERDGAPVIARRVVVSR